MQSDQYVQACVFYAVTFKFIPGSQSRIILIKQGLLIFWQRIKSGLVIQNKVWKHIDQTIVAKDFLFGVDRIILFLGWKVRSGDRSLGGIGLELVVGNISCLSLIFIH